MLCNWRAACPCLPSAEVQAAGLARQCDAHYRASACCRHREAPPQDTELLSLYYEKEQPNLAGYLVLRQSRFARIRLFALPLRQAWGWEAAHSPL